MSWTSPQADAVASPSTNSSAACLTFDDFLGRVVEELQHAVDRVVVAIEILPILRRFRGQKRRHVAGDRQRIGGLLEVVPRTSTDGVDLDDRVELCRCPCCSRPRRRIRRSRPRARSKTGRPRSRRDQGSSTYPAPVRSTGGRPDHSHRHREDSAIRPGTSRFPPRTRAAGMPRCRPRPRPRPPGTTSSASSASLASHRAPRARCRPARRRRTAARRC